MPLRRARALLHLVVVGYLVALVWLALTLPARVPMHFDPAGEVDRWSSKSAALAFWAGLGVIMLGGGALLARHATAGRGALLNVPHKDYWLAEERLEEFRLRMESALLVTAAWTGLLLIGAMALTSIAARTGSAPGWWFWTGLGVYLVGLVGQVFWLNRSLRPPHES